MDRYFTMRPINLSGEVTGYRAELLGVGSGADAIRTIMQNAINRVGVSITPVVCQQLFIEVLNSAVDFSCDSGTSVNIADVISFKWNTRGKYDRVDATVPKSALSLTAVISPKITRNATPRFDLKAQPISPVITSVKDPIVTNGRGVFARGYSLSNVGAVRFIATDNPTIVYASYGSRGIDFDVSDNGRELVAVADATLVSTIPSGKKAQMQVSLISEPTVWLDVGATQNIYPRDFGGIEVLSATPQPWNLAGTTNLTIQTEGNADRVAEAMFFTLAGDRVLGYSNQPLVGDNNTVELPYNTGTKYAGWIGGVLRLHLYDNAGSLLATFNVNVASFNL